MSTQLLLGSHLNTVGSVDDYQSIFLKSDSKTPDTCETTNPWTFTTPLPKFFQVVPYILVKTFKRLTVPSPSFLKGGFSPQNQKMTL